MSILRRKINVHLFGCLKKLGQCKYALLAPKLTSQHFPQPPTPSNAWVAQLVCSWEWCKWSIAILEIIGSTMPKLCSLDTVLYLYELFVSCFPGLVRHSPIPSCPHWSGNSVFNPSIRTFMEDVTVNHWAVSKKLENMPRGSSSNHEMFQVLVEFLASLLQMSSDGCIFAASIF